MKTEDDAYEFITKLSLIIKDKPFGYHSIILILMFWLLLILPLNITKIKLLLLQINIITWVTLHYIIMYLF